MLDQTGRQCVIKFTSREDSLVQFFQVQFSRTIQPGISILSFTKQKKRWKNTKDVDYKLVA